jgi:sugar phosphate isomerase/epimerase
MKANSFLDGDAPVGRRAFLRRAIAWTGLTGLSLAVGGRRAGAIEPFQRTGPPRLAVSLAAYSFRDFLPSNRPGGAPPRDRAIDLFQFVDFCAEHGCAGAELTSYYFPAEPSAEFLLRIKRHAFLRGVVISGTAVGNTFTLPEGAERAKQIAHTKRWVDHAQVMGAPHIRVFAGDLPPGMSRQEAKRLTCAALEECSHYAGQKGIFLGLENHGGIVAEADDLLDIVKAVQSPWLGVNLDGGNFHSADPYADLARCAPYAVNVQVKVEVRARGQAAEPVDLRRLAKLLRDANYQGFVALEYEAKEDPWTAVPRWLQAMKEALAG